MDARKSLSYLKIIIRCHTFSESKPLTVIIKDGPIWSTIFKTLYIYIYHFHFKPFYTCRSERGEKQAGTGSLNILMVPAAMPQGFLQWKVSYGSVHHWPPQKPLRLGICWLQQYATIMVQCPVSIPDTPCISIRYCGHGRSIFINALYVAIELVKPVVD